jgi:DNA-binding response OmpR family regulator
MNGVRLNGETGILAGEVRLLVVEDEVSLAQALRESLEGQGFRPTVVHSADAAWEALWAAPFELLLLDVMLPEGDEAGFKLAQDVREAGFRQPILFLTARETLDDRVRGLEFGDDYLAKPFAVTELIARLKALYRRGEVRPRSVQWRDCELLLEVRQLRCGGELVRLTAKEFEVLELFMLNPGRIFSRSDVLERVWGASFDSLSNLVDVYVKNLRGKVKDGVIETVRGSGYRFPG